MCFSLKIKVTWFIYVLLVNVFLRWELSTGELGKSVELGYLQQFHGQQKLKIHVSSQKQCDCEVFDFDSFEMSMPGLTLSTFEALGIDLKTRRRLWRPSLNCFAPPLLRRGRIPRYISRQVSNTFPFCLPCGWNLNNYCYILNFHWTYILITYTNMCFTEIWKFAVSKSWTHPLSWKKKKKKTSGRI